MSIRYSRQQCIGFRVHWSLESHSTTVSCYQPSCSFIGTRGNPLCPLPQYHHWAMWSAILTLKEFRGFLDFSRKYSSVEFIFLLGGACLFIFIQLLSTLATQARRALGGRTQNSGWLNLLRNPQFHCGAYQSSASVFFIFSFYPAF